MQERKHAAIMFTDIVGYTALMGTDEDRAFEVLAKNREIHTKLIEQYHGTLIKEMGDGMLISFNLASDAVRCAIDIQNAAKSHDIPLKIGIHEGEMVFEGNDVLGDGVNIASRIQDSTESGCIMISGAVYRDIKNKTDIQTEFEEEKKFKNVDEKIRVFRVSYGGQVDHNSNPKNQNSNKYQLSNSKQRRAVFASIGFFVIIMVVLVWQFGGWDKTSPPSPEVSEDIDKSIAVRPFWNENSNKENDAFINGMTEDIRINLAKIADLRVLSRGSVEKYRDSEYSAAEIAIELDVAYILEGTVQRIGNQVKIQVQLIFGENDDHIWQDTYLNDISNATQIFDLQSEIAKSIATQLRVEITPVENAKLDSKPTNDLMAYEKFIEGREYLNAFWRKYDRKDVEMAHKLFHESLTIDPNFVWGYTGLGFVWGFTGLNQLFRSQYIFTDSLKYYADRVIELDPKSARGYGFQGSYYKQIGDFQKSIEFFEKSVLLDPNFCWPMEEIGYIYCNNYNDYITGIPYLFKGFELRKAQKLDIELLDRKLGMFYLQIGDYEKAKYYLRSDIKNNSNCLSLLYYTYILGGIQQNSERGLTVIDSICSEIPTCNIFCSAQKMRLAFLNNQFDQAVEYMNNHLKMGGNFSKMDSLNIAVMYLEKGNSTKSAEILDKLEKPLLHEIQISSNDWTPFFILSIINAIRNEKAEALKYIREMERLGFKDGWHDFIEVYPGFKNMWGDPEFQAIVKREQHKKAAIRAYLNDLKSQGEISL